MWAVWLIAFVLACVVVGFACCGVAVDTETEEEWHR